MPTYPSCSKSFLQEVAILGMCLVTNRVIFPSPDEFSEPVNTTEREGGRGEERERWDCFHISRLFYFNLRQELMKAKMETLKQCQWNVPFFSLRMGRWQRGPRSCALEDGKQAK